MSATLSWIPLGLGALLLGFGWFWMVVVAFQRSLGWGLFVLLFPLAGVLFLFVEWRDAKRPFVTQLVGLAFCAFSLLSTSWPTFMTSLRGKLPVPQTRAMPAATTVDSNPREQPSERLAVLKMRERQLIARKAKLDPKDTAAAHALAEDIARYNAELKAAQEEHRMVEPSGAATGQRTTAP